MRSAVLCLKQHPSLILHSSDANGCLVMICTLKLQAVLGICAEQHSIGFIQEKMQADCLTCEDLSATVTHVMQVPVLCGATEKLSQVQEPSRCEYTAQLLTPAACTSQTVQAVHARLTALKSDSDDHIEL